MTHPADLTGDLFPWETQDEKKAAPAAPPATRKSGTRAGRDADATAGREPDNLEDGRSDQRGGDNRDGAARTGDAIRERAIAQREYYSISEVCELVGLKPHVLRYWESQFAPLNPSKNRSGNRVYQRKEIRLIMLVKRLLYEDKYTIEGARARIDQMRRSGKVREMAGRALDLETVGLLRAELERLREILAPPA
ncbi:MAG: MerR family transcriptional regulator [Gemmatimonadetes bacterium]|nr:MerR family transcriptional regulator [Gemmatimonadota bacterium]